MEIKITTNHVLKVLQLLSWIIFIGLCIEAGGIFFNACYAYFANSGKAFSFLEGIDLSSLYNFDSGYFLVIALIMTIISTLKAILLPNRKIIYRKKLNMSQPFSEVLRQFILKFSYLTLGIGLFCNFGFNYTLWFEKQGVILDNLLLIRFAGSDVWFFMTVVLFVITQIVKKGIEIQNENDLTI